MQGGNIFAQQKNTLAKKCFHAYSKIIKSCVFLLYMKHIFCQRKKAPEMIPGALLVSRWD